MLSKSEILWLSKKSIGDIITVEQFTNALTNDVFLITNSEQIQFVFKRLNLDARSDDDRQAEYLVQQLACRHNLTAKVIAHNHRYKLQQYIIGELLDCNADNLIEILAEQLVHIHQIPALHAPKQRLAYELRRLKKQLTVIIDEKYFQKMLELAEQLDENCENDTLCHGDLSVNNVLLGKDRRWYVLDWEYAVIACAAYDLAFCNCINGFSESKSKILINAYYSRLSLLKITPLNSLQSLQKKCVLYSKLFIYINKLWSLCFVEKD
jgi:thiamine kinase-like enzyme